MSNCQRVLCIARHVDLNKYLYCLLVQALQYEPGSMIVSSGALATVSGPKTGRAPKDKRVVQEPGFETDIWRGNYSPNYQMGGCGSSAAGSWTGAGGSPPTSQAPVPSWKQR